MTLPFWCIIWCCDHNWPVTVVTSSCFFFSKSKNKKKDKIVGIKNKRDLNKRRETEKR